MKFRATVRYNGDPEPCGIWHRRYGAALADARAQIAPHKPYIFGVEDSKGEIKDLSETQYEKGIEEYHAAIEHRDAVGVWG